MSQITQLKTYKLMSVNTAPQRAVRMIGKLAADVSDRYNIVHCANAEGTEYISISMLTPPLFDRTIATESKLTFDFGQLLKKLAAWSPFINQT